MKLPPRVLTDEETTAGVTQEQARAKEEAIRVYDPPARPPVAVKVKRLEEYLADPTVLERPAVVVPRLGWLGVTTLLVGSAKSGKSTLLSGAAVAVQQGGEFLGDRCAQGDVVVLCLHEGDDHLVRRLYSLGGREGIGIIAQRAAWPDVAAALSEIRPRLIIVDSLVAFATGGITDSTAALEWARVLGDVVALARELKFAAIVTHHPRKGGEGRTELSLDDVADSRQIVAGVDAICLFTPARRHGTARRIHTIGRDIPPEASRYLVDFDGCRYQLASEDAAEIPDPNAEVLAVVAGNTGIGSAALRAACQLRSADVDAAVRDLVAEGLIEVRLVGRRRGHFLAAGTCPEGPIT